MTAPRRVCVVTGTRAEYGLLHWVMVGLRESPGIKLQVVATAMHVSPEYGLTVREIEADGFTVDERVEMLVSSDTNLGMAKSMGLGVIGISEALTRLGPDIVIVLGDRFETFSAAQSAMALRIPIAHLHGGELTEGAFDESIRHAITKMAHLHLVAAEPFRRRVLQLGEAPEHVFVVGAPGLDHVHRTALLSPGDIEREYAIGAVQPLLLVTHHPATLVDEPRREVIELLEALECFPEARIVFTKSNADPASRSISESIDAFVDTHVNASVFMSLGQRHYLSLLRRADAVVGNSSSGIIEAPALGTVTVNIGDRQLGRLRTDSVIDTPAASADIEVAIREALSSEWQDRALRGRSPYGDGQTAERVVSILSDIDLDGILVKRFVDREFE